MTSREKPPAGASFFTPSVMGPATRQQEDGACKQESPRKQGNESNSLKERILLSGGEGSKQQKKHRRDGPNHFQAEIYLKTPFSIFPPRGCVYLFTLADDREDPSRLTGRKFFYLTEKWADKPETDALKRLRPSPAAASGFGYCTYHNRNVQSRIGDRIVPSFFSKNGWKEYETLKDDWHNPDFALHWDRTDLEGNPVRAGQLDLPFFFSGDGCVPMPRFWIWASDPERWKRGCFAFGQTSGWWAWMRPRPCSAWRNSG